MNFIVFSVRGSYFQQAFKHHSHCQAQPDDSVVVVSLCAKECTSNEATAIKSIVCLIYSLI